MLHRRTRCYKKKMMSPAQFDREYEQLLKREGTFVYTKEGTRVSFLKTGGYNTKQAGRRKMFITRANSAVD
jgi:hypothetical protein